MILVPIYLKQRSSPSVLNTQLILVLGSSTILLTFKFFELAFSYKWTYIQQIPSKLAIVYLIALPSMPDSETKSIEPSRKTIRQESIASIIRGICQFIILQILFYLIPHDWFTLPPSLLSPIVHSIRCSLFSIILYLLIDFFTGIMFGIYSLTFNLHMKRVFPQFPFASTSLREFWSRRWNKLVQKPLHLISFVAIPNLINPIITLNNTTKGLLAFALSGFIHEYVLWFTYNVWSVITQLPLKLNTLTGKIAGWLWTTGVMLVTLPLFFDPLFEKQVNFNANVIPVQNSENVPNLFNLPGMLANNRSDITLLEGDIALPVHDSRTAYTPAPRWPNGIVPIEFDGSFTADQQNIIIGAMSTISQNTNDCIRFVWRSNNPTWLRIHSGQGCWSHMGKVVGSGSQDLSLQIPSCVHHSVALHELLHALGFAHEQTRTDRDTYVRVYYENIEVGQAHNFDRYASNQVNSFGEAYDYGSIMHYRSDAFSSNGRPTIKPILAGYENWESYMGRGDKMSAQDIKKLKAYYGCP
ncbi:unnamed protein product [Adineta steineri]|uniref:Metalloendopeptidase n=1 Tax=Adineta steineri TaxID=433720 RepID=A0A819H501_9BILA|nr:unnamed protein product [Adineta steineri]